MRIVRIVRGGKEGVSVALMVLWAAWLPLPAAAHGAVEFPKARALICYEQRGYDWPLDGSNIPNDACKAAYLLMQNSSGQGAFQFNQWAQVTANPVNPDDQASVERAIPDGRLCAAGDRLKAGLDVVSSAWQKTPISLHDHQFRLAMYLTQTHDPSFVKIYLSKPDYSAASRALRWSDLQLIYENLEPKPEQIGNKKYYFFDVRIPAGRTGPAVLYTRWQRQDSGREGFYSCSDIVLEGAGVEIPWYEKDPYVTRGFEPKPGETVRFRVMGHQRSGGELVDERLPITAANASTALWAEELAKTVNSKHAAYAAIGVLDGEKVHYDATHYERNMMYVKNDGDLPVLSIIPKEEAGGPEPITAELTIPERVQAGERFTVSVDARSASNKPLTYDWKWMGESQAPAGPKFKYVSWAANDKSSMNVQAGTFAQDVPAYIRVVVSDGTNERDFQQNVLIEPKDQSDGHGCGGVPAWVGAKAYAMSNEKVSYHGYIYEQAHWSQGAAPDTNFVESGSAKPWRRIGICTP